MERQSTTSRGHLPGLTGSFSKPMLQIMTRTSCLSISIVTQLYNSSARFVFFSVSNNNIETMSLFQSDHKPVCSNFSVSVFSSKIANDLLLPCFNPIVKFIDAGPYYVNEDLLIIYTVNIENRRFMNNWDWIGLYRVSI